MKDYLERIVYYATLAPSGHNTQPWKFRIQGNEVTIHPDYERALPVVDPDNHALFISLGCALENMVVAATHFNLEAVIQVHDDSNAPISVVFHPAPMQAEDRFFRQLETRQSTRRLFNGAAIPASHLRLLQAAALCKDVRCVILQQPPEIDTVAGLIKEACIRQFKNRDFVAELRSWIRFNKQSATQSGDGLYGSVMGQPDVPNWMGKLFMRLTLSPEREGRKCEEQARSASALAVFVAERNDIPAWIHTGRSFERFALTATALGIRNAHLNMPCEELPIREKLAQYLRLQNGEQPLLLVRIGYADRMPYAYRRPLKEVISKTVVKVLATKEH